MILCTFKYEIHQRNQQKPTPAFCLVDRFMTKKTIKHTSADVGLIFTAYNLKRIFNLIDTNELKKYLKVLAGFFNCIKAYLKPFCHLELFANHYKQFLKRLSSVRQINYIYSKLSANKTFYGFLDVLTLYAIINDTQADDNEQIKR